MERKENTFAQIKDALAILVETGYPGLRRDIIDIENVNKILDVYIINPPLPRIPNDIEKYPKEFKGVKEYNKVLLDKWIELIKSMPYIYYIIDIDLVETHNIISGCFPINHMEMNEDNNICSGTFAFEAGGFAKIDFNNNSSLQGSWEDVYKALADFVLKLTQTIIPEISK